MKKALLWGAFVILTNLAHAGTGYAFDPTSIRAVVFDAKECRHFDGNGVGCTHATLVFGSVTAKRPSLPKELTVVFLDPSGKWEMTLRYHPKQCQDLGRGNPNEMIRFRCAGVSWRTKE